MKHLRLLAICLLLLGSVAEVLASDSNLEVVMTCITKHKGESKAVEKCAKQQHKSKGRLPELTHGQLPLESKEVREIREIQSPLERHLTVAIDSWRVNKKLSPGEAPHHANYLAQSPNKGQYKFCGYKVLPDTVYNSGWQVLNPNDSNVAILTTTGDELIVDFKIRWVSKYAAGNSKEDINCEGDGWRINPTYTEGNYVGQYNYKNSSCVLFVKLCHLEGPSGRSTSEFCGICAGFDF
jgi:hypothetical protein